MLPHEVEHIFELYLRQHCWGTVRLSLLHSSLPGMGMAFHHWVPVHPNTLLGLRHCMGISE